MVAFRREEALHEDKNHVSIRYKKIPFFHLVFIVILSSLISPSSDATTTSLRSEGTPNATYTTSIPRDNKEEDLDMITEQPYRILYMVTASSEYNNGGRATVRGQDRMVEQMIPIMIDGINSLISPPYNFEVDVYVILGWKLKPERRKIIEDALPEGVGLEIWDDAMPYDYKRDKDVVLQKISRALPRQQRYVVKDKIDQYDFFISFEDDMRITGAHVDHFLGMTEELRILAEEAPESLDEVPEARDTMEQRFYGNMTKKQVGRLIPGFIRVEALLNESRWPSQEDLDPIPVDLQFAVMGKNGKIVEERKVDPNICCQSQNSSATTLAQNPDTDAIILWETAVFGAVVRQLPKGANNLLDWVLLQPGPIALRSEKFVGGYWSGRDGVYGEAEKPPALDPKLCAQQGGWMATREQLIDIHENHCNHWLFPPYEHPKFIREGLYLNNVEYWSGGLQMFTGGRGGCNMQRVISLHPDHFSKHLIYHTSNNKQKGEFPVKPERLVKANNFYGQVNSVVKAAQRAMYSESRNTISK